MPPLNCWLLESAAAHTTEERLGQIAAPVLVVGGEKDGFTPFDVSARMVECLPQGELYKMRGGSHTAPLEQPQLMELVLEDWLCRQGFLGPARAPEVKPKKRSSRKPKKTSV